MKKFTVLSMVIISAAACMSIAACSQPVGQQNAASQSAESEKQTVAHTGIWIDVRSADEYAEGHLKNALNIPHDKIAGQIAKVTTDKNAPIHLYCRSGRRAELAKQSLLQLGYTNVINHGAYQDLINQNK